MNFPLASTNQKPVFGLSSEKALYAPLGATSPLWLAFAGVATVGVAYWWMTRWMKPFNIEALVAKTGPVEIEATPLKIVEVVTEAAVAPVVEAAAEVEEPIETTPIVAAALPKPASSAHEPPAAVKAMAEKAADVAKTASVASATPKKSARPASKSVTEAATNPRKAGRKTPPTRGR